MKYLKSFNEQENMESKIESYLKENFPSSWFDIELQGRVYDYIDADDAEKYDDDYVEAYKNLSTGAAIEYDLCDVMVNDVCQKFGIESSQKFGERDVIDIVHDHLMDHCSWKDEYVFNKRSTEPYKNPFFGDLGGDFGDFKI